MSTEETKTTTASTADTTTKTEETPSLKRKADEAVNDSTTNPADADKTTETATPEGKKQKVEESSDKPKDEEPVQVDPVTGAAILKQVNFYFGDANFPKDNFLRGEANKNPEGWVNLSVIMTFNRMKQLSQDVKVIVESIKESDIVELSEDKTKLRRKKPVIRQNTLANTIYSKPYPLDAKWEDIEKFWSAVAPVAATRLRRDRARQFKGSVFIQFETEQGAKDALASGLSYEGAEMKTISKQAWIDEKKAEREARKAEAKPDKSAKVDADGNPADEASTDDEAPAKEEKKFTPGRIVSVKGVGVLQNRDQLKSALEPFGQVMYVDYPDGAEEGFVRFASSEGATAAVEAFADGQREILSKVATIVVIDGDQEKEYWEKVQAASANRKDKRGGRRGGRRRGGGRGGGRRKW
mmetsp:Transcript_1619/g.2764  ORF Transcript_1619/g.2764 Transcript_1619/m.2764 type:complete len:411 (-) Transcript_1619:75-1307(-)